MEKSMSLGDLYVILVEPSATQCRIISELLTRFGVSQVKLCDSAEAALAEMTDVVPDLIISAMYLPDMSGADLVKRMRDEASLRDVGFILISSETEFRYLDPVKQAGVLAILPKPFTAEQLKRALYTTLDYLETEDINLKNKLAEDLSVLVVDDSKTARHHIKRTLNALGIEKISEATDGKEAAALIADNYFDLIVTDFNMPEMDGKELIRYIREESNQASIPILMVTSEENASQLAAIEQAGVSAICDKPFDINTVRSLIQNIVV